MTSGDKDIEIRIATWVGKVLLFVPVLAIMLLITPVLFTRTWFSEK